MSADGLDHYDVEAMIRDALISVRADYRDEIAALRDELRQTHNYLQGEIDYVDRTLQSRTGHLT